MNALPDARSMGDVLRHHAQHRADKLAFTTLSGGELTFGQFNARVNRLCNAMAKMGLEPGARVAILSRNRPEYVETFGLSKSGIIIVPLNWRLAEAELARLLQHSAPDVLIVDEAYQPLAERLAAQLPGIRHLVSFGPASGDIVNYEALLAAASADEPTNQAQPDDILCIVYTSGTTGAPKGVKISHRGALDNCRTSAGPMLGLHESEYSLAVLPLFHVGGMWYHLFPSFATGCTTLLLSDFEPGVLLREIEARRITNVHLVPTMISAMLNHPYVDQVDTSHLRLIFYAASSMPAELLRRAMLRFPNCGFSQGYGSTEAGVVTVLTPDDHLRARNPSGEHLLSSCGRPFDGRKVRITDDVGTPMAQSQIGEIVVRSPGLMAGYWRDDAATERAMQEGWFKTGDLGYSDSEGYIYIVDRKNDMVITGGENVYPTEVEAYFYRDPDVLEAAVFGLPDPQWVEKVVAAVVLRPGSSITSQQLIDRLKQQLAAYKCPKEVFFTSDLPKSAAGKVLRKELRKHYGSEQT